MAQIKKINIKGVDYDIGGTGGGSENIVNATQTTELDALYSSDIVGEWNFYKLPLTVDEILEGGKVDAIALPLDVGGFIARPVGFNLFVIDFLFFASAVRLYCPIVVHNLAMYIGVNKDLLSSANGLYISIEPDVELPLTALDELILNSYLLNNKLICNNFAMYLTDLYYDDENLPLTAYSSSLDSSNLTTIYKLSITSDTLLFTQITQTGGGLKVLEKTVPEDALSTNRNNITEYFTSEEHDNLVNGLYDAIKLNIGASQVAYLQKTFSIIGVSTGYTGLLIIIGVSLIQIIGNASSITLGQETLSTQ